LKTGTQEARAPVAGEDQHQESN
jgi:hypothetical protein